MISWNDFLDLVIDPNVLNRRIDQDQPQEEAVQAGPDESLFIIAGPGSGKTTVLTLRVLKLIFVDNIDPAAIIATTFTRKAASELRSRILGWGDTLRQVLVNNSNSTFRNQLEHLDLNRIVTGTIDSIAEQTLTDFRQPGTQPPIPLEEFVSNEMMKRFGLWIEQRHRNQDLINYAQVLQGREGRPDLIRVCRDIRDRLLHDQVDVNMYRLETASENPGVEILCQAIEDYTNRLQSDLVVDFAGLEEEFFNRLESGSLTRFTGEFQVILVDEYQDTNLLQESIYFSLARQVVTREGSITIVGDDDQSLYRFRGASVELFTNFIQRLQNQINIQARPIYLQNNYRSTGNIVDWYSNYIILDPAFAPVRVEEKPQLQVTRPGQYINFPIIGMFRHNRETLARDLASFIETVFFGAGVTISQGNQTFNIIKFRDGGDLGDCALLCDSPREYSRSGRNKLPLFLRQELEALQNPIQVFNPRGREFSEILVIEQLCGLILECIDPDSRVQDGIHNLPQRISPVFNRWRIRAQNFIDSNPTALNTQRQINTLVQYVQAWQTRTPQGRGNWPNEVPLIRLLYDLITWIPVFQDDPEGLVYLEVITRAFTQSGRFIHFGATIQRDSPFDIESIESILWGIFVPLADGTIELDEGLIEFYPRDRLNIMSIHQAKGLEFPLTIVDVSSEFKGDYWRSQGFKRFPLNPDQNGIKSSAPILEDTLRPYSPLGSPNRGARDREFDDLIRQFFVAFSRSQDVLLLVGLSDNSGFPKSVPNVATGWIRDISWPLQGLPGVVLI